MVFGGISSGFIVILFLVAIFKIFSLYYILKNFRLYPTSLNQHEKWLYNIIYFLSFYTIQWLLLKKVFEISFDTSFYLDLFIILLIPIIWIFKKKISYHLRSSRILLLLFSSIIFGILIIIDSKSKPNINENFEAEMAKALNLKFVNSEPFYRSAMVEIAKDTIAGFSRLPKTNQNVYYIQSLKNPKSKVVISRGGDYELPGYVLNYNFGKIFIKAKQDFHILTIGVDANEDVKFPLKEAKFGLINLIIPYKNFCVLGTTISNEFGIYDITTEKLRHHFKGDPFNNIIDDKLFFRTYEMDGFTIHCWDLNHSKLLWKAKIKNARFWDDTFVNSIENNLLSNDKVFLIPSSTSLHVLNLRNGKLKYKFDWVTETEPMKYDSRVGCQLDSNFIFFSDKLKVVCKNLNSSKTIWQISNKNVGIVGQTPKYLLLINKDRTFFYVIRKSDGKFISRIKASEKNESNIKFLDEGYILIGNSLYKG